METIRPRGHWTYIRKTLPGEPHLAHEYWRAACLCGWSSPDARASIERAKADAKPHEATALAQARSVEAVRK